MRQAYPAQVREARSRTGCVACRHRRVRCDEKRPSCRNCRLKNQPCIYRPPQLPLRERRATPGPGQQVPWYIQEEQHPPSHDVVVTPSRMNPIYVCPLSNACRSAPWKALDPFDSLPIKMPYKSKELLFYFFQIGRTLDDSPGIPDNYVTAITRDPSALQNTMLVSGLHYSWNSGDLSNFETTVLFHKTQSIRRINSWLDSTSRAEEVRLCVQHISALCFIECCLGNFATAKSHLNGLMAYLSAQQSEESDSDKFRNIETELVNRYLIIAYTVVYSLENCLNDFLASGPGCQDDSPPSDSEESRRLIHEWHVRKSGLNLRLQALRIVPFFFSAISTDKMPSDINVYPIIRVLQDITYLYDARRTTKSSEVATASLWKAWKTSGTSRLLFMVIDAHIQSFSDTTQSPIEGRQPVISSWSGFCVVVGMFFCTILGIWNRGFPLETRLHQRMIKILQGDLQRSLSCLKTVGKEDQALWFWKAFIGVSSLVHAKSVSNNKWLDDELSALIYKLRTWSNICEITEWIAARKILADIVWPESSDQNSLSAAVWRSFMRR